MLYGAYREAQTTSSHLIVFRSAKELTVATNLPRDDTVPHWWDIPVQRQQARRHDVAAPSRSYLPGRSPAHSHPHRRPSLLARPFTHPLFPSPGPLTHSPITTPQYASTSPTCASTSKLGTHPFGLSLPLTTSPYIARSTFSTLCTVTSSFFCASRANGEVEAP